VVHDLEARGLLDEERRHVSASFQATAVEVLVQKTLRAVRETGCNRVLLGGGVSANALLRSRMAESLAPDGRAFYASPRLSLDNGAMVARAAHFRWGRGDVADLHATARADLPFPGMVRSDLTRTGP